LGREIRDGQQGHRDSRGLETAEGTEAGASTETVGEQKCGQSVVSVLGRQMRKEVRGLGSKGRANAGLECRQMTLVTAGRV
jgi:hypothetical protein